MIFRRAGLAVAVALASGAAPAGAEAVLASAGVPAMRIVTPQAATAAERRAADELASYLGLMVGAEWPQARERGRPGGPPAIHVGATRWVRGLGLDPDELGPEQWIVRVVEGQLVVAGGRPRGTLYAVYRLLEDELGVRWWTATEQTVPERADIVLDALDRSGEPALAYRDLQGITGPRPFHARNRLNGHYSFLSEDWGGRHAYGPPFQAHTVHMYVPAEPYFAETPEFFSEIDGKRRWRRGQLCLSNDRLLELATGRLREYIEQSRRDAQLNGTTAPTLFDFSDNDWGGPCECARCLALLEQEGSYSGALLRFVNAMARDVAEDYPEIVLDTLAYRHTHAPPRETSAEANVVVRVAALFDRDFLHPLSDPVNRTARERLEGWRQRTSRLRVWDYAMTAGREPNNFPLPNLPVLASDLRYYVRLGVDGVFLQLEHPLLGDMRDLKVWVLAKLLEDPGRDLDALVDEFTSGYYGAAGASLREMLAELSRAAGAAERARIRYPTDGGQFVYLDRRTLPRLHRLFDRAEQAVARDPLRSRRVREARISLDRATLWRWEAAFGRQRSLSDGMPGRPLSPVRVADRLRGAVLGRVERLEDPRGQVRRQAIEREIDDVLRRLGYE